MNGNISQSLPRGSEWRKWDLHFHTSSSYDYEEKSVTDDDIIANLKKAGIKVVAITDHHFIDAQKIKNLKDLAKADIVFLPGIEFCSDARGSEPIHFIGIFPEGCNVEYIWNEINSKTDIAKKKQEGKKDNEIYCDLEKTSKLLKGLGGIVSIHAGSKSNSIEKITNSLPVKMAEKEDIAKWVDIFELGQEKDQEGYTKKVFPKIGTHPMIICSDNHNAKVYKLKQLCWIKADPTFEGLKQIIYEPEDRVKIQELKPEEKSDYNIIDRVEYKNFSGAEKQVVYFNQNLNSIIGSRATGKSNLLRNIAFSIDPEQCREKNVELKDFLQLKDFKVFWRDKKENTLALGEDKRKGILFIPQRYLGGLVYERGSQFDEFLSSLFENKEDFSQALQNYRKFENENILEITSLIRESLAIRESGREKQSKIKKLGKKEEIESEIKKIDFKLNEINKTEKKITSKELEDYKRLTADKSKQERNLKVLDKDITSLESLKGEEVITAEKIFEFEFSQKYREKIEKKLKESDELFKKEFIELEIDNLKKDKDKLEKAISGIETGLKPLRAKVEKHQALVELTKSLQDNKEALRSIISLKKELDELRKIYNDKQIEVVKKYLLFNEQYRNLNLDIGVLEFSVVEITTSFDEGLFKSFIEENINYHNSISFRKDEQKKDGEANNFLNDPAQWTYNKSQFSKLLKQLLLGILSGNLLLKSGRDEESVLIELFKNRFKVNFLKSIKNKRGDEFEDMTDGEKALALLEFIFKLDDYNYPVLIDQPEDDLDARAISKHIVDFLKNEKIKRQIMVASHNANLVVCGDSEEVIVSNKSGGKNPNFKYPSGAIENPTIRDEIIEVLEGGKEALAKRRDKLGLSTS